MKKNHHKIGLIILVGLSLFFVRAISTLAEDKDIGLRVRSDGADVPVAICSSECSSSSPLKIYKGGVQSIKLVDTTDPSATKLRVQTSGGTKAVKKYVPINGRFVVEQSTNNNKWLSKLTCKCADGSLHELKYNCPADRCSSGCGGWPSNCASDGNPFILRCKILDAIASKGLNIPVPGGYDATFGAVRNNAEHIPTLDVICKIMGYDSYVTGTAGYQTSCYDGRSNYFHLYDGCYLYFFDGTY